MLLQEEPEPLDVGQRVRVEVLVLCANTFGIRRVHPHGSSGVSGVCAEAHPHDEVKRLVASLGLTTRFVHSTSWRWEDRAVILTYVAVVDPPADHDHHVRLEPVPDGSIVRGGPTEPPLDIDADDVMAHTLRHLAWLVREDSVASEALLGWRRFLEGHDPEPFGSFAHITGSDVADEGSR